MIESVKKKEVISKKPAIISVSKAKIKLDKKKNRLIMIVVTTNKRDKLK